MPFLLIVAGGLALAAIALGRMPWMPSLGLAGLVLVVAVREIVLSAGPRSVTAFEITRSGRILLASGGGRRAQPGPQPGLPVALCHFWVLSAGWAAGMMGLEFANADGQRFRLILFRDQVDARTWRRLVVRLRLGGLAAALEAE